MAGDSRLRIHRISYKDIGAFREFDLHLDRGQNLLVYGDNGSGKTSFARLLRKWLWSASTNVSFEVHSLFSYGISGNMVNLHAADAVVDKRYGEINASVVIEVQGTPARACGNYKISSDDHETYSMPMLRRAEMASDFVNYRVFYEMFRGAPETLLDLWPVFLAEILPFCGSDDPVESLSERWTALANRDPFQEARFADAKPGEYGKYYKKYNTDLRAFGESLRARVTDISLSARTFYEKYFGEKGVPNEWWFELGVQHPSYDPKEHRLSAPLIQIGVKHGDKNIPCPHEVLNEAELTKIALSIRFGATKTNLQHSPLKLLVLDDLLISLDMSNRVQVINIILADPDFADYQKIIMTHDRGFYQEIRRAIGSEHTEWMFGLLHRTDGNAPQIREDPSKLAFAERLLSEGRHDEAALQLRKSAEETLRLFIMNYPDSGEYKSLSDLLRQARGRLEGAALNELLKLLDDPELDEAMLQWVIPKAMLDLVENDDLSAEQKTRCCGRRTALRKLITELRADRRTVMSVLAQIEHVKDRILNPAAHEGAPPLYEGEMREALELVRMLKNTLCRDTKEKEAAT